MAEVTLSDWILRSGAYTARGSRRGAVLNTWTVREGRTSHHLIDGYDSVDHMNSLDGCRSAVLAPWSNRINNAQYSFAGRLYDCGADASGMREALHGYAYVRDWDIVSHTDSSVRLALTVGGTEGYPFRIGLSVTYRLDGPNLYMELEATNEGDTPAPVGLGWHPYFLHDGEWSLTIPAQYSVRVDDRLIPLPTDTYATETEDIVLRNGRAIDTAYTGLRGNTVCLDTGSHQIEMTYTGLCGEAGVGSFHVYTGDALTVRSGESVAVEPCEFIPDAFNRDECAPYASLEPAESRRIAVRVRVKE